MEASRVIVSAQTIQSTRLFLMSQVPDPNRLIGHYLTYHPKGDLSFTFPGKPVWDMGPAYQPRTAIGSLQLRGLYNYTDRNGKRCKGGKFSVYDPYTCTPPIRLVKGANLGPEKKGVWGAELVKSLQELRNQAGVSFSFTGDAMSLYDNRVELDPIQKDPWGYPVAKTFYRHHDWDIALSKFALQHVTEIVEAVRGQVRTSEPQQAANPGYGHVHGSLRAGLNPDTSVLDANCQSHSIEGLYVVDASFMPTAGASNPSLTLIANALRVCESIPSPD
jgi:choline dehydrogenase-like flavoprotein